MRPQTAMSLQTAAHDDAEMQRRHVRLKVPIRVEIDGARYRVEDWSVGGFGVENVPAPRRPGERFRVRVVFPFEDFELAVRVDARMVYVDRDRQRFGCRFLPLTARQLDLFRHVADAHLSGEIVAADDLLRAPHRVAAPGGRGAADSAGDEALAGAEPEARPPGRWRRARRHAAYAAAALAGLVLLGLAAVGVHDRYLTAVEAASAVVDAPLYRLRAPIAGVFTSAIEPGETVDRGQTLAVVQGSDGTVAPLDSPCACVVLEQPGLSGEAYRPGDALIALAEADRPPWVRAQVPLDAAERLEVGGRATIRFPGRGDDGVLHGEIARISVGPSLVGPGAAIESGEAPPAREVAQVLIRPDRPLDLRDIGTPVAVRFP